MSAQPAWQGFAGRWQCERNEKFEEYLAEMGANWFVRKMAAMGKGILDVGVDQEKLTINVVATNNANTFLVNAGVETDATFQNGKQVKAKTYWQDDGKKLVMEMSGSDDGSVKPQKITRELNGDTFVQTMEVGDLIAKRYMKRVPQA